MINHGCPVQEGRPSDMRAVGFGGVAPLLSEVGLSQKKGDRPPKKSGFHLDFPSNPHGKDTQQEADFPFKQTQRGYPQERERLQVDQDTVDFLADFIQLCCLQGAHRPPSGCVLKMRTAFGDVSKGTNMAPKVCAGMTRQKSFFSLVPS